MKVPPECASAAVNLFMLHSSLVVRLDHGEGRDPIGELSLAWAAP